MITTAITVAEWMYRGSDYTLPIQVLDEEGDITELPADRRCFALLYDDINTETVLLQKEASTYYNTVGLMLFLFEPEDTEDLMAKSYDLSVVLVDEDNKIKPLLLKKFGIFPFNPPTIEGVT